MKTKILILTFLLISSFTFGIPKDYSYTDGDVDIFNQFLEDFQYEKETPTPILFTDIAKYFIGTPYQAGTLELIPEQLVVNLRETDCILFIEMCTALTLTVKGISLPDSTTKQASFELYCENLKDIRYRNGEIAEYASRLHYTSEWIIENQRKGIFQELTSRYGEPITQIFSFMSSHPEYYPQLKDSNEMTRKIRQFEEKLSDLGPFYSIPEDHIGDISNHIEDGDIICFVTKVQGLDISHVGIALWVNENLHFIHASSKEKEVVIEQKTLEQYTKTGIRVVRFY